MNDVYVEVLDRALALHKQGNFDEAEVLYNRVLNRKPLEESILFLLSDLYMRQEKNGLAINLLMNLLQNNQNHGAAWCNLGVAFRKENNYAFAKNAWTRAIAVAGETPEVCNNLATLYADRAEPAKAIEWCEKALVLEPNNFTSLWQKALATLTLGDWKAGWALYENRQLLESWDARASIDVPIWKGEPVDHLYIHGEQGVGDEIMFASMLQLVTNAQRITVEVHEKVAPLIKRTWPHFTVVTTETAGDYDAKVAIGSLHHILGAYKVDAAYLVPDPARVAHYRAELAKLGPGPYVALTWMGGMKATRVEDRSMNLELLRPVMETFTCVSAQYDTTNPIVEQDRAAAGLAKIDDTSIGGDLADQAALFAAVDAVVTVQQTAVHVAGAVGTPCYALIGSHPHWRYGVSGDSLPWYPSVRLFRQKDTWERVVARVLTTLKHELRKPC
jgi:tetratricopeptide (TPR) repeat protein